jgi:hypothetical protein
MTTRRARAPRARPANRAATKPRAFRPPLALRAFAPGAPPARSAARRTRDTNRRPDEVPRARGGPGRGTNRSSSSRFTLQYSGGRGRTPAGATRRIERSDRKLPAEQHVAAAATCRRNPCADNGHDARTCRRLLSCRPCHFPRLNFSPLAYRLFSARHRLHMGHIRRTFSERTGGADAAFEIA